MENNLNAIQTTDLNGHQQLLQEVEALGVKYIQCNIYTKNILEEITNGLQVTNF